MEKAPEGREGTATMAARKPGKEWCDWEEEKEWAGEDERVMGGRRCLRERRGKWFGLGWVGLVGSVGYLGVVSMLVVD